MRRPSGPELTAAALGVLFLSYTVIRAVRVPLTCDEAFTGNHWVDRGPLAALTFDGPERANNHLLNSLLAGTSQAVFGRTPFALRLPNLIAHAVFLIASWRLLSGVAGAGVSLAGFALLNGNPLLLELFGLARGYGLALGFVAPALLYAVRAFEVEEIPLREEAASYALLVCGVLAQLIVLDVFAAVAATFAVLRFVRLTRSRAEGRLRRAARESIPVVAASLFLLATALPIIVCLRRSGALYSGGTAGLWYDTVSSVVRISMLNLSPMFVRATLAVLGTALAAVAALATYRLFRPGAGGRVFLALVSILFSVCAAVQAQHVVFDAKFPENRIAIVFLPLLVFALAAACGTVPSPFDRVAGSAFGAAGLLALALFARRANLSHSDLWWFDADNVRMLEDLDRLRVSRPGAFHSVRLSVTDSMEPSLNWYRKTDEFGFLAPVSHDGPFRASDYTFVFGQEEAEAVRRGYRVLARYPGTGNVLLEPSPSAR
ncbi:MAG: hypothetical protein ACHQM4_06075 [Thermoanaerobaculia bacterium]